MKNNGHIFTPSSPLHLHTMSSVIEWVKWLVLARNNIQRTELQTESPARSGSSFLLSMFLKEAPFHSDCEQLTGDAGCEKVLLGYFATLCTAPSLQGLVVPLSGDELQRGATSPAPSLNRRQLPFITALPRHRTVPSAPSQHPWCQSRTFGLHEISFSSFKKV